jgi:hypothetical protein
MHLVDDGQAHIMRAQAARGLHLGEQLPAAVRGCMPAAGCYCLQARTCQQHGCQQGR